MVLSPYWEAASCVDTQELPNMLWYLKNQYAGRGGRAVWGMNSLRSLRYRDCEFESRPGHGCLICVPVFLCLCCPLFR
jgi:hypothetical protein